MSMTDTARNLAREAAQLAEWEMQLLADLAETRTKRRGLAKALSTLLTLVSPEDRREIRAETARHMQAIAPRRRKPSVMTPMVAAVHAYLAEAEDLVSAVDIHDHLAASGLTETRGRAYQILARKVRQGMLFRVARGLYRVNAHDPEIARLRAGAIHENGSQP